MRGLLKKCLWVVMLGTLSTWANSSVIQDTLNDSFIDTSTGIEWMDFGINNHLTLDQVRASLSTTFAGWSIATEAQVLRLAKNAFDVSGGAYSEISGGYYYTKYSASGKLNWSVIPAMATNMPIGIDPATGAPYGNSFGWFQNSFGSLSYLSIVSDATSYVGQVFGRNFAFNEAAINSNTSPTNSMMLVRTATIPAPASLGLMLLGLLCLTGLSKPKQMQRD